MNLHAAQSPSDPHGFSVVDIDTRSVVARIPHEHVGVARLMEAAPDLLAACKDLLDTASKTATDVMRAQKAARAAIAKAEGR